MANYLKVTGDARSGVSCDIDISGDKLTRIQYLITVAHGLNFSRDEAVAICMAFYDDFNFERSNQDED